MYSRGEKEEGKKCVLKHNIYCILYILYISDLFLCVSLLVRYGIVVVVVVVVAFFFYGAKK